MGTLDWSQTRYGPSGRLEVQVRCPDCPEPRWTEAGTARYREKQGTWSGRCYKHRHLRKRHSGQRGPRTERPTHPAIDWTDTPFIDGQTRVAVVCPKCGERRYAATGSTTARIRAERFSGLCLGCSKNARKHVWIEMSPGCKIDPHKGYIRLTGVAIADEDRWLYDAMRGDRTFLLEHRLVMARELGRPLTSNELVDHRDGVKTNNALNNLRLYRRGKNDDGSGCGYGTFYDEWQRAEAELRRLRAA